MSDIIKILGQTLSDDVEATLYTVPTLTSTTTSSLVVCNTSAVAQDFMVAAVTAAEVNNALLNGVQTKHYLYYDRAIAANDTFTAVLGMTLAEGDAIIVFDYNNVLAFTLFGVETLRNRTQL